MKLEETTSSPVAQRRPHSATVHGLKREDDYFWLRDREDDNVIAYLEAENDYTEAMTAHTKEMQESLYQELLARIKETDQSAPYPHAEYFYYHRTEGGLAYPILCRRGREAGSPEQVILDINRLAEGHEYFRIGTVAVSLDHRLLAFSSDTNGAEEFTLAFKNLETGDLLADSIPNTNGFGGAAWADDKTIFYAVNNKAKRPYKIFKHQLGQDSSQDEEVFHEEDDSFYVRVSDTTSLRYVMIVSESNTTSEVRVLDLQRGESEFRVISPRRPMVEYSVQHQEDRFVIRVNDEGARNFRLVEAPIGATGIENWREIIPHRDATKIEYVIAFKNFLAVFERTDGLNRVRVIPNEGSEHYVELPDPVYTAHAGPNLEYDASILRFHYTSLTRPDSAFDYEMSSRDLILVKQQDVLGGYEPTAYTSERIFATAPDGVKVPISLVYRNDFVRDGSRPLWLTGYGSYGISSDPFFSSLRLSLLDRGFAWGIAHVRGGGDLGEQWKEAGKLLNKRNTFTDFIACAEHLIEQRYTSPERLAIQGGSAGGLLVGAVINMRPELFNFVVAQVPFVDCVNTILDESLPLTVTEWEEWGNPNEKDFYDYMMTYSPYDNVEPKAYPNMLVTAGLNDPRVSYWEPAKWVAKLRALKTDDNLLLLKTQMGAGHAGPSGRYNYLREEAFKYAVAFHTMKIG